ncbi:MAG TPA: carbon storage regulator [Steroidobacteraceae bacterium]|jgi:carbon storage regulator
MLVLSRRANQALVIGGQVTVRVLQIGNTHVELGIEAPQHVAVDREEIHLRKQREQAAGGSTRSGDT